MKISIITSVYNSINTIESCIQSILSQDYNNIEYIIIDGVSNDGTLDIINKYKNRISLIVSEPDKGIYDALNKGYQLASGEYIGLLHSDDYFSDSNVITRLVANLKSNHTDAIYADLDYVTNTNPPKVFRKWKTGTYKVNSFQYGWMLPHPTFYVKKEIYEKYGYFNTNLKSAADYELMLRLIHKHKISLSYLPETIVKMRVGGQSNRSLLNRLKANLEDRKAWEINQLKPNFFTLFLKPLRKLPQWFSWKIGGLEG